VATVTVVSNSADAFLELPEAAALAGVHYQTVYRWVRTGRLEARRIGGKYFVAAADLAAATTAQTAPAAPRPPSQGRLKRQAERMQAALLGGDETEARLIARRLTAEGTSMVELIELVIVPPLRFIGEAWRNGEVTIWAEHRASSIVDRILGEVIPNPRGRRRGTAMVASVSGDLHSLPTTMATAALREANWVVHHLGANMPPDELVGFCAAHNVDLAVISLTNQDMAELARDSATRLRKNGVRVVLGGPGRSLTDLIEEAGSPGELPS
jgi:MerR family transcriptional regulator, light-induced transcriptional regulator